MANNKRRFPTAKKKIIRKQRRPKFWRIILFLCLLGGLCWGLIHAGIWVYSGSMDLYASADKAYIQYKSAHFPDKPKSAIIPKIPLAYKQIDNILFIGIRDYNNLNDNASALFLFNINHNDSSISILQIPVNTTISAAKPYITLGNIQKKGTADTLQAVSKLLGINITQYIIMDEATLLKLLNGFNGLDLYVPSDMNYEDIPGNTSIHLKQGYQHLNNKQLLEYLEYRSDDLNDVGKAERQKKFLQKLPDYIGSSNFIFNLPTIFNTINKSLLTNTDLLNPGNIKNYLWAINKNSLTIKILPGHFSSDGLYWIPAPTDTINATINKLFFINDK